MKKNSEIFYIEDIEKYMSEDYDHTFTYKNPYYKKYKIKRKGLVTCHIINCELWLNNNPLYIGLKDISKFSYEVCCGDILKIIGIKDLIPECRIYFTPHKEKITRYKTISQNLQLKN